MTTQTRTIRPTHRGGYLVIAPDGQPERLAGAYATEEEARAMIARLEQRDLRYFAQEAQMAPHRPAVARVLSQLWAVEARREIQRAYAEWRDEERRAAAYARASVYSTGQTSCLGRDRGAVYSDHAGRMVDRARGLQADHQRLSDAYRARVVAELETEDAPAWAYTCQGIPSIEPALSA